MTYDWTFIVVLFLTSFLVLRYVLPRPGWVARLATRTRGLEQAVTVRYWRIRRRGVPGLRRADILLVVVIVAGGIAFLMALF